MGLNETCELAVAEACSLNVGLIDTSEHYGNLELVGAGFRKAGKGSFVVTKISGMPCGEYKVVKGRMQAQLDKLGIEKADCCLIHWPGLCDWDVTDSAPLADFASFESKCTPWEVFVEKIPEAWANMRRLQEEGFTSHIGTSNFYAHHLEVLAETCDGAQPFMNEIFIDCMNQEVEYVKAMQGKGIHVLAYRPLGYFRHGWPEQITSVATRHSVSPHAVVLAWLVGRGIYPLTKCRGSHVQENIETPMTLKDALTEQDKAEIASVSNPSVALMQEFFANIWVKHKGGVSEEDVAQLVCFGVTEEKAREALERANGNMELAMNYAFE